jgi:proliferating cell nuclear antigen
MMQAQDVEMSESGFSIFGESSMDWRAASAVLQSISEDVTFDVDADGIRSRAMDPSHVALVEVSLSPKCFEKYACLRPARFSVHMEDFSKIVKRADSKESFQVSRTDGASALSIRIGTGHYRKEFELHLLETDPKSSPLPKLAFTTRFKMDLYSFYQILNDVSTLSNYLTVVVRSDQVVLSGKGDSGKVEVTIGKNQSGLLQEIEILGEREETRALYNLEYLLKLVKSVTPYSDMITFEYANKMPLKMEFLIGKQPGVGKIQYYLAPKIIN